MLRYERVRMKFTVVAVGKLKERFWVDACAEYLKRLQPYAKTQVREIPDVDPRKAGGVDGARDKEGAAICAELEKLTKELLLRGGYGNVNIAVKVEISADSSGDDVVLLESSVATKYPKQKLGENTSAKISDGGTLVQCQQANMFSEKK